MIREPIRGALAFCSQSNVTNGGIYDISIIQALKNVTMRISTVTEPDPLLG